MTDPLAEMSTLFAALGIKPPAHVYLAPVPIPLPAAHLARWQSALTPAQFRVVRALLGDGDWPTRPQVAERLGVHVGTVHQQLGRIKKTRPAVWREIEAERARQRKRRHEEAVKKENARSERWHRRQGALRYRDRFDCWPWERPVRAAPGSILASIRSSNGPRLRWP